MIPVASYLEAMKTQFTAWWRCENTRPLLYVPARWPKAGDLPAPPADPRDAWLDAETILERERAAVRHAYWGGIAFPVYTPYPPTAGFFGAKTVFTHETLWHEPVWAEEEKPYEHLAFDASHPDWLPLLKKIQAAGKTIMVDCRPEEVEPLCEALRPEGLFIGTACDTPEEAEALIGRVNRRY